VFLLIRFAFRFLVVVVLLGYVFIGMAATNALYKRNMYRGQDMSSLYADIDDVAQGGDSKIVTAWLIARPLAETDKLVEIITPKSAALEPAVFFEISRRQLALGRPEEALFWLQLGRYRLVYDIIRCGAEPDAIAIFDPVFKRMHVQATDDLLQAHPELLKKTVQRVLDFDAKYPAHDNPLGICKAVLPKFALPAEEINWEGYHQLLRKHNQDFLNGTDKAKVPVQKK